ncbi:MAG TPA: uroporphyrinogen decarboxylase family protein [Dehalococcoidia bacterium]|jgi:uroporphyrinogen decarboxylase|nr:uroporphyrinogen decarboxylase family protein [Dehalococcoidia bacterium]
MAAQMSKQERVSAALKGQAVDHVPVSAWWHDYAREWSAEELAETTLEAYETYGWDFIKVNPRFSYYAEDWGTTYRRFDDRMPEVDHKAVQSPEDLRNLGPMDGTAGAWAEQLQALRLIRDDLAGEAPFIQTVFSPLAVMTRITGSTKYVQKLIAEHPDDLDAGLTVIEQTLIAYAKACLDLGASGIFYAAVEWGSADNISWADYERFGKPYDLRILAAVSGAPLNVLHVCRDNNHLRHALDYPVAAFHWDVHGAGNPAFTEALASTSKAVIGGVRVPTLLDAEPSDVTAEAHRARAETDDRRFLLAPGCSINPASPPANLRALVQAARS